MSEATLSPSPGAGPVISVDKVERLKAGDMDDLCDAAESAIREGGGFGWVEVPERATMERYWHGVLAVPGRTLFVGRLDGTIAGACQLVRPPASNQAQAHAAQIMSTFVAPWARGHGVGRAMIRALEAAAREDGHILLNLDVRESQQAAISLYEGLGYTLWATHPFYARVQERFVAGRYYFKRLDG